MGKIQRAVLEAIKTGRGDKSPISTVELAQAAYALSKPEDATNAQLVATRRALRGLQRKTLVGSHGRQGLGCEQWFLLSEQQRNAFGGKIEARGGAGEYY